MIIHLNEIPLEGKSFYFDQHDKKLSESIEDLVESNPYKMDFKIQVLDQAFDLQGSIEAQIDLECSFCLEKFSQPVHEKYHEILVFDEDTKVSGWKEAWPQDSEPHIRKLDSKNLNAGELAHEIIALAEPIQPKCKNDCRGLCSQCGENQNLSSCDCASHKNIDNSAFSVLKELKLH